MLVCTWFAAVGCVCKNRNEEKHVFWTFWLLFVAVFLSSVVKIFIKDTSFAYDCIRYYYACSSVCAIRLPVAVNLNGELVSCRRRCVWLLLN